MLYKQLETGLAQTYLDRTVARGEKFLEIVNGGGWVVRQVVGRPKTRLFLTLSFAWLAVSVPALFHFFDGWPESFSMIEFFALVLVAPHPIFIALAVWFSRTEQPCIIEQEIPNPDYDRESFTDFSLPSFSSV